MATPRSGDTTPSAQPPGRTPAFEPRIDTKPFSGNRVKGEAPQGDFKIPRFQEHEHPPDDWPADCPHTGLRTVRVVFGIPDGAVC